jgi:hypothetical protein
MTTSSLEMIYDLVEEEKSLLSRCSLLRCLTCARVGGAGVHNVRMLAMRVCWRRPRRGFALELERLSI